MKIFRNFLFCIIIFLTYGYSSSAQVLKFENADRDIVQAIQGKLPKDFSPSQISEFRFRLDNNIKNNKNDANPYLTYLEFLKWLKPSTKQDLGIINKAIAVCNLWLAKKPIPNSFSYTFLYKRGLWLELKGDKIKSKQDFDIVNNYMNNSKLNVTANLNEEQINHYLNCATVYYVIGNQSKTTKLIKQLTSYYPNNGNVRSVAAEIELYKKEKNRKRLLNRVL